jgi:predicted metalloprotease with PDZ domain
MKYLAVALAVLLLGAAPAHEEVDYTLAPELHAGVITALAVEVHFRGDRSGTTVFDWSDSWAGEEKLGQWARDLTVEGAQTTAPAPHGGRIIHAAPGAPIVVRYRVISAFAADPTVADSRQFKPVVRPTWFYSVGEALFGTPAGRGDEPARFTWAGPPEIGFASDLQHNHARLGKRSKTVDDIVESIVVGGRDLRVTNSIAGGAPLQVATIGRYAFDTPAFEKLAADIVATERRFWRAKENRAFLIAMTPVVSAPGKVSYSGTGRSDAFALWMDTSADISNLGWLLAHEYFHTWNYRQLGEMASGENEPLSYWMSEGFTDFYARRLLVRAGLITPVAFANSWNEMLAAYARSAYRDAPEVKAAADFWTNRDAEKIPYQRGAMLAALWDARLHAAGRGNLDDLLRDQQRRRARMAAAPSLTELFATTAAAHRLDVRPDLARYVERGEMLALPASTFGRCATVTQITRPVFERGYDADATSRTGVITGLDPRSPAYEAGLRNSMRLLRRTAGVPGNAQIDYTIVVSDHGTERSITFRPGGRRSETLQQIVLSATLFAADSKGCAAMLAG